MRTLCYILITAVTLFVFNGCASKDEQADKQPLSQIRNATIQTKDTVTNVGQEGVKTMHNAGMKTGVTPVVQGVSQAIVDTSEEIGTEKRGNVMGQEVILFPPETQDDGKVLKIEF